MCSCVRAGLGDSVLCWCFEKVQLDYVGLLWCFEKIQLTYVGSLRWCWQKIQFNAFYYVGILKRVTIVMLVNDVGI